MLPYSLDTNNMRFQRSEAGFLRAKGFAEYVIDAFDWLWEEGATMPRMMRIARRDEIARHWLDVHGKRKEDR